MFARSSRLCSSTWEVAWVLQHRAPCFSSSYLRVSFYFKLWCDSILYLDAPQAANHLSEMKLFSLFSSLFLCFAYLVWTGQSSHTVTSIPSNSPSCFPALHASVVTGNTDAQPPEWHFLLYAIFLELRFTVCHLDYGCYWSPCLHIYPLPVHSLCWEAL